jgi:hypothetical protein
MLKKVLQNKYIIGGVVVFGILTLIGILALDTSWWESALFSAVLAVVGMVSLWWKEEVW